MQCSNPNLDASLGSEEADSEPCLADDELCCSLSTGSSLDEPDPQEDKVISNNEDGSHSTCITDVRESMSPDNDSYELNHLANSGKGRSAIEI